MAMARHCRELSIVRLNMKSILLIILSIISFPSFGRDDLPKNIKYIEASETFNDEIKQLLAQAFSSKKFENIFDEKVICGPALWNRIRNHPKLKGQKLAQTTFIIPSTTGAGKVQELKGGLFQTNKQVKIFLDILSELPVASIKVRKINKKEAGIYWKLIPYDIEEPVFTIEYGDLLFLADVNKGDKKVFWIDEFSLYRLKSR